MNLTIHRVFYYTMAIIKHGYTDIISVWFCPSINTIRLLRWPLCNYVGLCCIRAYSEFFVLIESLSDGVSFVA